MRTFKVTKVASAAVFVMIFYVFMMFTKQNRQKVKL